MKKIVCPLALALVIFSTMANAGRPLATEDAGFIEKGGFELESYYHRETARDTAGLTGFHIQPSVGIGFNTQLGIGVDFTRQYNEDFGEKKSAGKYALVGKTGIKELTDDAYGIAVAYSFGRTRAVGERYRYDNAAINGALTVPVEQWLFHANLGWARSRLDRTNATTWAFAAERTGAIGPVDLAAETFGDDHGDPWLGVAARWVVREDRFFIDASWAQQTGTSHARSVTVGLKLAF